jgi:hypothetical protein
MSAVLAFRRAEGLTASLGTWAAETRSVRLDVAASAAPRFLVARRAFFAAGVRRLQSDRLPGDVAGVRR